MRSGSLQDEERGSATTEAVLIVPVLLFLVLLIVQFGLWYHAENVARAAAEEGARAAKIEGGTADAGQARADAFLAQAGGKMIEGGTVTATRTATVAAVTVRGTVVAVVPGLRLGVHATATSPTESFTPPGS